MAVKGLDLVGKSLAGRFEILKEIGEGGYGAVFLANQTSMDRTVAIKVIHPKLAQDPSVKNRFEREARIASKLQHPNTVIYFDFGNTEEVLFLAMEFVKGHDLSDAIIQEGPFDVTRAAHIARQVCGALREAHGLGMVHRDLKPANILLTHRDGDPDFVKVIDFGLAKIVGGDQKGDMRETDLTMEGTILGTPAYMSPEQIKGGDLDGRCDIYALGIIMFAMLTGQKPFHAASAMATAVMQLSVPMPSVRQYNPRVPEAFEELIFACTAKDPVQRPASVDVVAKLLEHFLDYSSPRPIARSGIRRIEQTATLDQTPTGATGQQLAAAIREMYGDSGSLSQPQISGDHTLQAPSGAVLIQKQRMSPFLALGVILALVFAGGALAMVALNSGSDRNQNSAVEPADPPGSESLETRSQTGDPVEPEPTGDDESAAATPEIATNEGSGEGVPEEGVSVAPEGSGGAAALAPGPENSGGSTDPQDNSNGSEQTNVDGDSDSQTSAVDDQTEEEVDSRADEEREADRQRRAEQRAERERREAEEAAAAAEQQRLDEIAAAFRNATRLSVNARPYVAEVTCNNEDWGRTPIVNRLVEPGRYTCRAVNADGVERFERADVVLGEQSNIVFRFD